MQGEGSTGRRRGARAVLLGLAAVVALAFAATPAATAAPEAAEDLYVLNAGSGELDRAGDSKRVFRLLLTDPTGGVTVFTDRPVRRAGHRKLRGFIRDWNRLGFRGDPPNAALVIADAPNSRDVLVVTLSKPRLRAGGVAFKAKVVRGSATDTLKRFRERADGRVANRFGQVSLFIDPGSQAVGLTFTLTNLPPGNLFLVSFNNALLAHGSFPTQVQADGPAGAFLDSNALTFTAAGPSTTNATIESGANVDAGATSLTGQVQSLPEGASGDIRVSSSNGQRTQPLAAGRLSVPLP